MLHTSLRFLAALTLVVWLGLVMALSFFVAPELFSGRIEVVPDSGVAGEIMATLFHKMDVVAWISAPICAVLILAMAGRTARHQVVVAFVLLGLALGASVVSGAVLSPKMRELRVELKREFGSYDKAPKTDSRRAEFGKLHGISSSLILVELLAGLGAFFVVTQKLQPSVGRAGGRVEGAEETV